MRRRVGMPVLVAAVLAIAAIGVGCERGGGEVTRASAEAPSSESSDEATGAESAGDRRERYRTEVRPETIPSGADRDVQLAVVPASGLKVNKEYPKWRLSLHPPEGVELATTSFSNDDFTLQEAGARVSTQMSADRSGSYEISGTAGFSVCNDETCHIMRDETVSFRVDVTSNRNDPGDESSSD